MASTREIKRRIRGINNIRQITKAMELVSTAKLRRARSNLEATRPYYETVLDDIQELLPIVNDGHPLLAKREIKTVLNIVLTSDRGLAGGYNANIQKLTHKTMEEDGVETKLLIVGSKARDHFQRRNYNIHKAYVGISEDPTYQDAVELSDVAMELYRTGEVDAINLIYTRFESTISYEPKVIRLLPSKDLEKAEGEENKAKTLVEFEPSAEEVLDYLIPKYIESSIYGALIEAAASEQGSRRVSMEAATDNANDMIDTLETNYNRARQAAITAEISEIVGAADALS
ncbi:ATP synthase F1 subunit gamma [Peptoniphilus sp. KCTC 25270]|uniref:ATP synthase F1 subunit gamma n=1 Tax=Peptoniphilus sp. KCTC 25270 TaxID=2897414 RepID=UPI001E39A597|nr:ATP synthase F1 subunit gamma [Peptoniphilus sp. KCTC 25270]MCD1147577.1 ATP synthase F1 subunit gamma [Peptoniphilus sp. KCTC 25270]